MNYNPYNFTNTYMPYQPQQPMNQFAWVQGEASAKAYAVAPGSTVVLIDTERPVMYMKSTDVNGKPMDMQVRYLVTKEEYERLHEPQAPADYVTREEFEKYIAEAEKKFTAKKGKANE